MENIARTLLKVALLAYIFFFLFLIARPFPEVLDIPPRTELVSEEDVRFLADETFYDENGKPKYRQEIWDEVFALIDGAQKFVLVDMFLWNDWDGKASTTPHRRLAADVAGHLIAKKEANPHMVIAVITDPINEAYGGTVNPILEKLRDANIRVVTTDLDSLPPSNPAYTAFWYPFVSPFRNTADGGRFPHPFYENGERVSARTWLALLNFKANHRKIIIADSPRSESRASGESDIAGIVTSSNPHDGSSAHDNVALRIGGGSAWQRVLAGESALAALSGVGLPMLQFGAEDAPGDVRVTYLHDGGIRTALLDMLENANPGDRADIALFYFSDRSVIDAVKIAAARGVAFRILLDPNTNAFGYEKIGIPNRPVAKELIRAGLGRIALRWCDNSGGEQCHEKLLVGTFGGNHVLLIGSANWTRRNIGGYNLEANMLVERKESFRAWNDAEAYFTRAWTNADGKEAHSLPYGALPEPPAWKTALYRFMEWSGMSSF